MPLDCRALSLGDLWAKEDDESAIRSDFRETVGWKSVSLIFDLNIIILGIQWGIWIWDLDKPYMIGI